MRETSVGTHRGTNPLDGATPVYPHLPHVHRRSHGRGQDAPQPGPTSRYAVGERFRAEAREPSPPINCSAATGATR